VALTKLSKTSAGIYPGLLFLYWDSSVLFLFWNFLDSLWLNFMSDLYWL
jgi:hypothetical protein